MAVTGTSKDSPAVSAHLHAPIYPQGAKLKGFCLALETMRSHLPVAELLGCDLKRGAKQGTCRSALFSNGGAEMSQREEGQNQRGGESSSLAGSINQGEYLM